MSPVAFWSCRRSGVPVRTWTSVSNSTDRKAKPSMPHTFRWRYFTCRRVRNPAPRGPVANSVTTGGRTASGSVAPRGRGRSPNLVTRDVLVALLVEFPQHEGEFVDRDLPVLQPVLLPPSLGHRRSPRVAIEAVQELSRARNPLRQVAAVPHPALLAGQVRERGVIAHRCSHPHRKVDITASNNSARSMAMLSWGLPPPRVENATASHRPGRPGTGRM